MGGDFLLLLCRDVLDDEPVAAVMAFMPACDGVELPGVLAAARERFPNAARLLNAAETARRPLRYLAPGFTANRGAAARAAQATSHELTGGHSQS